MGKATIIEAQNSTTVFEGSSNSGILGHLKGVFADYKHGTRNSDRLYTEELWDNRVFGSEDVMEALETKTLFGELDHPEGDRCETLAKNAAISITKLEKRPDEGVIYGEAEILDTPTGRIVKALGLSGAKLGISSRGMGEEVYVNGQNIIDPETYDFITFDVVVTPANTKARVELTESKQLNQLTASFKKEITESETENQLNQLKTVIETVNTGNKDELMELVETKLNTFKKPLPTKILESNKQIALDLITKKYNESLNHLEESNKAAEEYASENAKLMEENNFLNESRTMLKDKLKESKQANQVLDDKVTQLSNELTESNNKLAETNNKLNETLEQLSNETKNRIEENKQSREIMLRNRLVSNRKTENIETTYKTQITELTESINKKDTEISKLTESNKSLEQKVNEYSKILVENKKLLAKIKILESKNIESKNKLEESKLQEGKEIARLKSEINKLQTQNRKMEEAQNRFSKLSFNPTVTVKAVAENFQNEEYDVEDVQLYNVLTGKN